ncbi:MAG: HAMP domain-containing protein [Ignavibacteriales bacterium]|nr:HAMP domain-containing protein [Ignavibacteriales bacterium]
MIFHRELVQMWHWCGIILPLKYQTQILNDQHTFLLNKAYNHLKQKNDSEIFIGNSETSDIIATSYRTEKLSKYGNNLGFVLFRSHSEATDLRVTLRNILILIGVVGIILALILSYVLTHRLRARISDLNFATAQTSAGNFDTHIKVQSNDEIGSLGKAFNYNA